ncbi:MAG: PilZ domain-containing protein [Acidobacteriota bacterium]
MSGTKKGFEMYLKPGLFVSVRGDSKLEFAAVVSSVQEDLMSLELVTHGRESAFQEGESVSLRFWDQETMAYHWKTEVSQSIPEKNLLTLSIREAGTVHKRRSYRVLTPIPFMVTVIQSAERELIGRQILDLKTLNLSLDGMLFQTELPLQKSDRLGLDLKLAQTLNAIGWVVRSELQDTGLYSVAVMFLVLDEDEQRLLVQLLGDLA